MARKNKETSNWVRIVCLAVAVVMVVSVLAAAAFSNVF